MKPGARGAEVEQLHRILLSRGHAIDRGEVEQGEFGPSTLAALHALQSEHGLKAGDEIDEDTLRILIEFELEQNITININDTSPPHKRNPRHGQVHGKFVDDSGVGIADTKVALLEPQLRSEEQLGERTTAAGGTFTFSYRRSQPVNLQVRAYDDTGKVIAQSAIVYAAPVEVEIDFTTAKDGVVRAPSVYTTLVKQVTAQLGKTPLSDLKENKQTHELTFVAKSIGAAFTDVAYLYIADVLAAKNALRDETLFGIFYQGIPASLDSALAHLPDAGIDDVFTAQVMAGVLAQTREVLAHALATSVAADVLPVAYSDTQNRELCRLDDLRVAGVGGAPYVRGKTSLNDLLVAGAVAEKAIAAFVDAYANNGQHMGSTWKALQNDKSLTPADLAALHTTLSAGEMLGGNLPLVKDTLQRLSNQSLASIQNLALLDEQDWIARVTQVDPNAATIPPVLPNETVSQRIGRLAKALAGRFGARWPTTAFAGALGKAESSTTFKNARELSTFLVSNPTFSFNHANIDHYLVTNKLSLSSSAMVELKAAQRLFRVTPQYPAVDALRAGGYQSAQSIYFRGRTPF